MLAAAAATCRRPRGALARYQAERSVEVLKLQNAARNSTEWFEHVDRYARSSPEQLAYSLLTRSQRISHENLRERDAGYVRGVRALVRRARRAWRPRRSARAACPAHALHGARRHPRRTAWSSRRWRSTPRSTTALPTDWHFVHLGARAAGGAGLVMTEMTCVAADARITPACTGLWNEAQRDAWARIVRFVHEHTPARIGLQLGHAGAKGATKKMWEGVDEPLPEGEWPLIAASETRYLAGISQVARAMTRADMDRVRRRVRARHRARRRRGLRLARAARRARLPALGLPLPAHQPSHATRTAARSRRARASRSRCSAPCAPRGRQDKPISVRISAHDWAEGGNTGDDAVAIARLFREAGADLIDVSAGQVVKEEQPVYGRMWQTPFADRVRQEAGIATIAVGRDQRRRPGERDHRVGARRPRRGRPAAPRESRPGCSPRRRDSAILTPSRSGPCSIAPPSGSSTD